MYKTNEVHKIKRKHNDKCKQERQEKQMDGRMDGPTDSYSNFHDDIRTQLNKLESLLSWGVTGKGEQQDND